MALAAPQQEAASRTSCSGEEQQFATLLDWGPFRNVSEMDQLPKDPSFSTFWSAVALGALSKGHPFQAVRGSRLACDVVQIMDYSGRPDTQDQGCHSFRIIRLATTPFKFITVTTTLRGSCCTLASSCLLFHFAVEGGNLLSAGKGSSGCKPLWSHKRRARQVSPRNMRYRVVAGWRAEEGLLWVHPGHNAFSTWLETRLDTNFPAVHDSKNVVSRRFFRQGVGDPDLRPQLRGRHGELCLS